MSSAPGGQYPRCTIGPSEPLEDGTSGHEPPTFSYTLCIPTHKTHYNTLLVTIDVSGFISYYAMPMVLTYPTVPSFILQGVTVSDIT